MLTETDVCPPFFEGYREIRQFSAIDKTLRLPHTGNYQVVVGGTRGNATYDLTIGIR